MNILPLLIAHHKKLLILVIVLLVASYFGFQWYSAQAAVVVEKTQVKRGNLSETLSLSGKIEADEKATIQFQTGGLVSWIGVKKGDTVEKYQAIASLDKRQLKNSLQQSLNTYMYNRNAFDQSVANTDGQIFTDTFKRTIDQAQQTMNNTILNVELQTLLLQLATITSPIDGIVTELPVAYPNVNVLPTTQIAQIVNPETIFFDVSADQTEVTTLSAGQTGEIVLDAYPDTKLRASIQDIAFTPKKDETGTVYQVKMYIDGLENSGYQYKLGMTGDVTFTTKQVSSVLFVPAKYVKTDENSKNYVLTGEKKQKVYVKTGIDDGERIEISGNISEGDTVYD